MSESRVFAAIVNKAVQDLAESSHYLYASIKAVDFQCLPPHDNVLGAYRFLFFLE